MDEWVLLSDSDGGDALSVFDGSSAASDDRDDGEGFTTVQVSADGLNNVPPHIVAAAMVVAGAARQLPPLRVGVGVGGKGAPLDEGLSTFSWDEGEEIEESCDPTEVDAADLVPADGVDEDDTPREIALAATMVAAAAVKRTSHEDIEEAPSTFSCDDGDENEERGDATEVDDDATGTECSESAANAGNQVAVEHAAHVGEGNTTDLLFVVVASPTAALAAAPVECSDEEAPLTPAAADARTVAAPPPPSSPKAVSPDAAPLPDLVGGENKDAEIPNGYDAKPEAIASDEGEELQGWDFVGRKDEDTESSHAAESDDGRDGDGDMHGHNTEPENAASDAEEDTPAPPAGEFTFEADIMDASGRASLATRNKRATRIKMKMARGESSAAAAAGKSIEVPSKPSGRLEATDMADLAVSYVFFISGVTFQTLLLVSLLYL